MSILNYDYKLKAVESAESYLDYQWRGALNMDMKASTAALSYLLAASMLGIMASIAGIFYPSGGAFYAVIAGFGSTAIAFYLASYYATLVTREYSFYTGALEPYCFRKEMESEDFSNAFKDMLSIYEGYIILNEKSLDKVTNKYETACKIATIAPFIGVLTFFVVFVYLYLI